MYVYMDPQEANPDRKGANENYMIKKEIDPTSSAFRLRNSPFYLLAHADFRYHEDMEIVMAKRGLNRTAYRIMTVLRETTASSISDLSRIALTKRTTVSRVVDRMEKAGLVTTNSLPEDNRVTMVKSTEKGTRTLADLTPIVKRQVERALKDIPAKDIDHLVATLKIIGANLEKLSIE